MAGWDDRIFSNLPARRPTPPPSRGLLKEMFPVDPREVVGGLYNQATEGAGDLTAGVARRVGLPNPELLGHDVTAFMQSPTFGGGMSPMHYAPMAMAAAPLAVGARLATGARTAEEVATGTRAASRGQATLDEMMAQGRANAAGYRTMADVPDIRGMHVNDAVQAAQSDPHLIEAGGSSPGFYIGAPRGVQSFDDLKALRARFDARLAENLGGADWYDRYRAGEAQATGNDPVKNLWSSKMHGTWSQGVNPESEAQFVIKEGTGAIAGQPTKAMYQSQHDKFAQAIAAGDPNQMQLGYKTGQYAQHVNSDYLKLNDPGATGVNDFRYANEWGYTPADGELRDGEVSLNPAQHRFLDYETANAVRRANEAKLGGRSDWTGEQIQATPWVSQKAAALQRDRPGLSADDAFAEANRTTPDFYDKHAANVTTEMQPAPAGVIPGHAPLADQMTPEQRRDYASQVRWGSGPGGRDVLGEGAIPGTGVGMLTLPTEQGTGLWQGESNPMEIGRPLVAFNAASSLAGDVSKTLGDAMKAKTSQPQRPYALLTGDRAIPLGDEPTGPGIAAAIKKAAPLEGPMTLTGNLKDLGTWEGFDPQGTSTIAGTPPGNKVMTAAGRSILDADAAAKAYFGAQQGVGYHKIWDEPTLGGANGILAPLDRPATVEEMTRLGAAGKPYGMGDVTSTHGGLLATGFDPTNPPPQLKPATRTALMEDVSKALPQRTGDVRPVRVDAGLQEPAWGQQGAGTATDWLLGQIGGNQQLYNFMNTNPGYGRVAGEMAQRDLSAPIGGQRPDIWNARMIAAADPEADAAGWADRLAKYRRLGVPASVAVGGAGVSLYPTAGLPSPLPTQQAPGTSLNSVPDWWRQQQDQRFSAY